MDTLTELWHRGTNPRWDELAERLAGLAGRSGGLAGYGADDPVEVRHRGGGIQVMTMRDLLLAAPLDVAGNWTRDLDLADQPVLVLGGVLAAAVPAGPNRTASGLLVPRLPDVPGADFWWDDEAGRLRTRPHEVLGTAGLVLQTAHQLATEPWGAVRYAWSRPDDAVAGFLTGTKLALVGVGAFAVAGGAGPLALLARRGVAVGGRGLATAARVGARDVTRVQVALDVAGAGVEAADTTTPCRGARVALAGLSGLAGLGLGHAFSQGGMPAGAFAVEAAAANNFFVSADRC